MLSKVAAAANCARRSSVTSIASTPEAPELPGQVGQQVAVVEQGDVALRTPVPERLQVVQQRRQARAHEGARLAVGPLPEAFGRVCRQLAARPQLLEVGKPDRGGPHGHESVDVHVRSVMLGFVLAGGDRFPQLIPQRAALPARQQPVAA